MGELFIIGVIGAISIAFAQVTNRKWKAVAADLGLEFSSKLLGGRSIQGRMRGFGVQIFVRTEGKNRRRIVAEVHGVDPGFTLGRDSALLRMIKPDIETGDQVFDERTRIEGDGERALAVLGDEARRLAEMVITGADGEVKKMAIRADVSGIDHAPSSLDTMLDLAEVLRRPRDSELPELLARRALQDSSRGVRLQAFRRLSGSFPSTDEARDAAEQLFDAHGAELRLEAGDFLIDDQALGERAAAVLEDLATRRHVDSALRREAVETLALFHHRHAVAPTLAALLDPSKREPPTVRRAALEGLVQSRAQSELLAVQPADAAEAELVARGLGFTDGAAQPRLLQLLEHAEDRVRLEAAVALGRVGDLAAVASLRRVAGTGTLFRSAVARAAESAISDIQKRAGGSQAGEISLVSVEPLQGAVSSVDADGGGTEGGEVSLTS